MPRLPILAACGLLLMLPRAHADVLLAERIKQKDGTTKPTRGTRMAEVERHFGAPQSRLDPRGGQKRQWPTIERWVYPAYTVYFERGKVIDVVLNQASPNELPPKPPIR
ncbi:hypothetical protein EBB59_00615 [Lysobacter pythonis]|uniref:Outer membrane protein assembly factor BamE n=1 Tax=Solilutibacter pythonis TaxID=2483112 RepID=A0A3M2HYM4_9GAMM|nr:hypothetical protein [Lysobacter pythonis]RMH94831.1 hypothetical protein EBB59_00615 [Lysobacter pythonis]